MNHDMQIAVRLPRQLVDKLDEVGIKMAGDPRRVLEGRCRSAVLRAALLRGLDALSAELDGDSAP